MSDVKMKDTKSMEQAVIRSHDFKTSKRLSREKIKTLSLIYENYTRLIGNFFSTTLGISCEANLVSVEEQKFSDYCNIVPETSYFAVIRMTPLEGHLLFSLSPEVGHSILVNLLGGGNEPVTPGYKFTEIDLAILGKVIRQLLPMIDEAWERIAKVRAVVESTETNLQFAQIVPPKETVVIAVIQMDFDGIKSDITFCLPQGLLEPLAHSLNMEPMTEEYSGERHDDSYKDAILEKIQPSKLTMKAILSETTIQVRDLINLQVGDVIQLDSSTKDPIKVTIGDIPRLTGELGYKNRYNAIRINGLNYEEESDNGQ